MSSPKGKSKSKTDFDKEYIFNLIMPSNPEPDDEAEPAAGPSPAPVEQSPVDSLSRLHEQITRTPSATGVPLRHPKNKVMVNLMEQLVAERLDSAFDKFKCCRCDKCKQDTAAYALNILTPHYVVAEPEEIPALLAQCPTKDVFTALVKAILYVKANPKH